MKGKKIIFIRERNNQKEKKRHMSIIFTTVITLFWLLLVLALTNTNLIKIRLGFIPTITGFAVGDMAEKQALDLNEKFYENSVINLSEHNIHNITSLSISGSYKYSSEDYNDKEKSVKIQIFYVTENRKYLVYELKPIDNSNLITGFVIGDIISDELPENNSENINNTNNDNNIKNNNNEIPGELVNVENKTEVTIPIDNNLTSTDEINTSLEIHDQNSSETILINDILANDSVHNDTNQLMETNNTNEINITESIIQNNVTNIPENISEKISENKSENISDNTTILKTEESIQETKNENKNIINNESISIEENISNDIIAKTIEYSFNEVCDETCKLDNSNGIIVIEIENAEISIDKIIYTSEKEEKIIQTKNITDQYTAVNQTLILNLSEYFNDGNTNGVRFESRELEYITVKTEGEIISYSAEKEGIYSTYVYAIDDSQLVRSNVFSIIITNSTDLQGNISINATQNITQNITNNRSNLTIIQISVFDIENLNILKTQFFDKNIIFKNLTKKVIIETNTTHNKTSEQYLLEIQDKNNISKVVIDGIIDIGQITEIEFINETKEEKIKTEIFAINSLDFINATITLKKTGDVQAIFKCEDYDLELHECPEWAQTNIPFENNQENNDTITFIVTDFTAYAGGGSGDSSSNLTIWDSTDTGMPNADRVLYTNESVWIYANYTNATNGSISGSCNISYYNISYRMSFNTTKNIYEYLLGQYITFNGLHDYTINCTSDTNENLSITDSYIMQNYSTTITTTNKSGAAGQQIKFTANFSSEKIGDIGESIYNTGDIGEYFISVALADLDQTGYLDDVIIGQAAPWNDYGIIALYANGSQRFKSPTPSPIGGSLYAGLRVLDADNDSFYDEIAMANSNGYMFIYNRTGNITWNTSDLGSISSFDLGDYDGQGFKNDFAIGVLGPSTSDPTTNYSHKIYVFNSTDGISWTQMWTSQSLNTNNPNINYAILEIVSGDIDSDGREDIIAVDMNGGMIAALNGSNGEIIFNTTNLIYAHSATLADIDHDSNIDDVVGGFVGNVYIFKFNSTYGATYNSTTHFGTTSVQEGYVDSVRSLDYNNDGFIDEFVTGDGGSYNGNTATIWLYDNNTNQIWNYTFNRTPTNYDNIYTLQIGSWNDDRFKEIIFSDIQSDNVTILNISGNRIRNYALAMGDIGTTYDWGTAIKTGDINNDGIEDLIIVTRNGSAHAYQEAECSIAFNDSSSGAMTFNLTTKLWEYARSFSSAGNYSYNITCSKSGYYSNSINGINISIGNGPIVQTLAITPTAPYTNDTLHCTFNITDIDTESLNISAKWIRDGINILNETINEYVQSTNFTVNLTSNLTYHNNIITCNITVTDGEYNISNITRATIQNYSTTLTTSNTSALTGQQIKFTANFSSEKIGDIGRQIWNRTSTYGAAFYTTTLFDCNGDGRRRCIAAGDNDNIVLYNYTFQSISTDYFSGSVNEMKPFDINDDGFDELITGRPGGIVTYLANGSIYWINSAATFVDYIDFGDVNEDGKIEIIAAQRVYNNTFVINSTGSQIWNVSLKESGTNYAMVVFGNFSDNGKIAFTKNWGGYGIINSTGNIIWNPNTDNTHELNKIQLDNDYNDELIVYDAGIIAFDDNNASLWSIPQITGDNYEIEVADIDNNGLFELIYGDGNYIKTYQANVTNATQKWNFTRSSASTSYFATSLLARDINDDASKEIIFGGVDNTTFILNSSGGSIYEIPVYGYIGRTIPPSYDITGGRHPAIDIGDVNGDEINEILVVGGNISYLFQDVKCIISFNDSLIANMSWNTTSGLWEYNRSFSYGGNHSFTVNCSKGGYTTQSKSNQNITVPNIPIVRTLTITPNTPYTNDTLECTFNITHGDLLWLNVTARWIRDGTNIMNFSIINYTPSTSYTINLSSNLSYHKNNIACNITVTDGTFNQSNATSVFIQNYSTTLIINNTNATAGQTIKFTANYSSNKIGDIGNIIWRTGNIGHVQSVKFADFQRTGKKNNLVVGILDNGEDQFYNSAGENYLNASGGNAGMMIVGDFDNDSYSDEYLESYWRITLINRTGDVSWMSDLVGESPIFAIGDIEGSGIRDDLVAVDHSHIVYVFNGSYKNWTQYWNNTYSGTGAPQELVVRDINNDSIDDILITTFEGANVIALNSSGALLLNLTDLGPTLEADDIDNDGKIEILTAGSVNLSIFNSTGSLKNFANIGRYLPNELLSVELYNDGNKQIVVSGGLSTIVAFNKNGSINWSYTINTNITNYFASTKIEDIDDKGIPQIISLSRYENISTYGIWILNNNGTLLNSYDTQQPFPYTEKTGKSRLIDVGDINDDGVNDAAFILNDAYPNGSLYLYQSANCVINFNDSTTANMFWNYTSGLWEYSRTFSAGGNYQYNVTCAKGGYQTQINSTTNYINPNNPPIIGAPTLAPDPAYTNDTLECETIPLDDEQTTLNVTFYWYRDGVLNTTVVVPTNNNSLTSNSLTAGLQNKNEVWNCTVNAFDGLNYGDNKSIIITINNTIPSMSELDYPENNDSLFTNRTPRFNWTASIDADLDIINYTLEVSISSDFTSTIINISTTNNYYIPSSELDFAEYFWRVRPFDGQNIGEYSNISNFTLVKSTDIVLINSSVNFGILGNGISENTLDNSPYPFILRNRGNSEANITINATQDLFSSQPLNTSYFQFLVNNSELDSFDFANSQTSWYNMTNFVYKIISMFNHSDSNDEVRIDISINVPAQESPGEKNTSIIFEASVT